MKSESNPRRPLTILHTSDVHLETDTFGSSSGGERLRDRVRQAFAEVVSLANRRAADLLLIVGDLFDSSRVGPGAISFALDRIAAAQMPVVMIPGNHDAHDERSIYASLNSADLPPNLHLILEPEGRTVDFPDLGARIWGRALVDHSPENRPLLGLPPPKRGLWNIAMAHGFFTDGEEVERSSPITPGEIESSGYDYIALGHVHIFSDVSQGATRALYCGTPAPLYASENAGRVAYVSLSPGEPLRIEPLVVRP